MTRLFLEIESIVVPKSDQECVALSSAGSSRIKFTTQQECFVCLIIIINILLSMCSYM